MQGQMFLFGVKFYNFIGWKPVEKYYLLVRIERDEYFISQALPKLDDIFFFAFLLPEVVSRKNDLSSDNKQKHYFICQMTCLSP